MHATVTIQCSEITSVWRGARASGDFMQGTGALIVRGPGVDVQIVGKPSELTELRDKLTAALDAEAW